MKLKPFAGLLATVLLPFACPAAARSAAAPLLPAGECGAVQPSVRDSLAPVAPADTLRPRQPAGAAVRPAFVRSSATAPVAGGRPFPGRSRRGPEERRLSVILQRNAQRYHRQLDSLAVAGRTVLPDSLAAGSAATDGASLHLLSPYAFLPLSGPTFYPSVLGEAFALRTPSARPSFTPSAASRRVYDLYRYARRALCDVYRSSPASIVYEESASGTLDVEGTIRETLRPERSLTERYEGSAVRRPAAGGSAADEGNLSGMPSMPEFSVIVRKPCFWKFKANVAMQFTQNYVSDNWYKGGESNYVMLASTVLEANYNNQQRLTFDNRLEMKLGFQTVAHDDEHNFRTSSDQLRLTNKLGLRAVKHWYYTVMLQSWTQFCRGYKANDPKIYSDFMSPFESLLTVGMDYKIASRNNAFQLNATLSPLAVDLKYVNRPSLVTAFGVNPGHHSAWSWGSNITVNYSWQIAKPIRWNGRFYWFTNYEKTQLEWENTFDFAITSHLSTRLFLYPRFDDSVQRKEGKSYFQFYELLSLGFNYNF